MNTPKILSSSFDCQEEKGRKSSMASFRVDDVRLSVADSGLFDHRELGIVTNKDCSSQERVVGLYD